MALPKPRGPAPYNAADPRTWDHEQTFKWLTGEFTKRARSRQLQSHKLKEEAAARLGKTVPPLDTTAPVKLAVDVDKLCPEGMTARHFGAMYVREFIQLALEVGNIGGEITPEVVKNTAAEVMGH